LQISCILPICTRGKPVANFIFALGLHASQTCCKFNICIGFTRESNLLQILYLHWIYTRVKPVANFIFALDLHARQTCCKFHVCIRFTRVAKLLQMSYLPKVCKRFALYGFAADTRFSNAFAYLQTRSLHAWQIWQI
jgi:hypothetical protein